MKAKARGQVTENSLISDLLSQENLSAEDLYSIKWAGASLYSGNFSYHPKRDPADNSYSKKPVLTQ